MPTPLIEIMYTLRGNDGDFVNEERKSQHVPRIGDLVAFGHKRSYQVVDVLWNYNDDGEEWVGIQANELDWHANFAEVQKEWRHKHD